MSYSRLQLYNDALLMAGERSTLTTLTEDNEPRRLLDQVWANGGVDACLEEAQWEFAMRAIMADYDPDIAPDFGYAYGFAKPSDWILTSAFCSDEFFRVPHNRYVDETGYWFADITPIYVRYVSNDSQYGNNMGLWPRSFCEFAAAHFASKIILKVTNDEKRLALFINPQNPAHSVRGRALLNAKSRCAMASPTAYPAQGTWSRSRMRGINRRDGGSLTTLIS